VINLSKLSLSVAAIFMISSGAHAQSLFKNSGLELLNEQFPNSLSNEIRKRETQIDPIAAESLLSITAPANSITLDLFPGRTLTFYQTGFDSNLGDGARSWTGRLEGYEHGYATLLYTEGRILGNIQFGDEKFEIKPGLGGKHVISQRSLKTPKGDDPLFLPDNLKRIDNVPGQSVKNSEYAPQSFPGRIRVLFMYTPQAWTEAQNDSVAPKDEALMSIAMANGVMNNSALGNNKFKYAGVRKTYCGYDESTKTVLQSFNDLQDMSSCIRSRTDNARNAQSADLVVMIRTAGDRCGAAYILGDNPEFAYTVVTRDCIADNEVFHQMGHNFGMLHEREYYPNLPANYYQVGIIKPNSTSPVRTIMSTNESCLNTHSVNCVQVPVISNTHPNGKWNGETLGRGLHLSEPAVNRKWIKDNWAIVAAFR